VVVLAMGLCRVMSLERVGAKDIDLQCDRIQMLRIAASTDPTQMVERQAIRDRTDDQPVGQSVDEACVAVVTDLPVPVPVLRSLPYPAAIICDYTPGFDTRDCHDLRHESMIPQ